MCGWKVDGKSLYLLLNFEKKVKVLVVQSCLTVTPCTVSTRLLCPWNSPGKNTGVFLLKIILRNFLTMLLQDKQLTVFVAIYKM